MEHLRLPTIFVSPDEGDDVVAQKVLAAILQGIEGRQN
jgi:hypothetical protein